MVLERAPGAGLTAHLGYERRDRAGHNTCNSRNGRIGKKVQTGIGPVPVECPVTAMAASSRCWHSSGRCGSPAAWAMVTGSGAQSYVLRPAAPDGQFLFPATGARWRERQFATEPGDGRHCGGLNAARVGRGAQVSWFISFMLMCSPGGTGVVTMGTGPSRGREKLNALVKG